MTENLNTGISNEISEREKIMQNDQEKSSLENDDNKSVDSNNDESSSVFHTFDSFEDESEVPKRTELLKNFLKLREIDEELTDIEEEKGDLPFEINSIKEKLKDLSGSIDARKERLSNLTDEVNSLKDENSSFEDRISKYDEQKFNVRSNTEYDEITKAIEGLFDTVEKNEKKIKEINKEVEGLSENSDKNENLLKELTEDLDEKESQLNELNDQFMQDESALREKRAKLVEKLEPKYVQMYERINGNYKGEATAIVRNGNCSGCYNSIPPQRVIEIKTAENIYTCQSCGRILISEHLKMDD
ncbi:MAG: C4-type zinc ribbon domain-containing protein [Ignavibacteria bacterium]